MKHKVLLTIDDSPSPLMRERLEFLRPLGIPVLWFCRGDNLSERMDVGVQALQDGHTLGNHSWDHPFFSKLSVGEACLQIDRTEALLEAIHERAGLPREIRCFRFPYEDRVGSPEHHAALQDALRNRGFQVPEMPAVRDPRFRERSGDLSWFWTFDLEDWTLQSSDSRDAAPTLQKVLSRLDEALPSRSGQGLDIFVGHDHAHTIGQWEAMILRLLDLDCEFVSVQQARAMSPFGISETKSPISRNSLPTKI